MVATHRLIPGSVFVGRYRVVRLLGQGAMGAVYLAQDIDGDAPCALKVIKPEVASEPKAQARFERETQVSERIGSPHVVQVLAAGVDGATRLPWLTMELLDGVPLSEYVERPELTDPDRRTVLEQLGGALVAAHHAGVIHRDLKPDNIFVLSRDGAPFVKVLDFGIAKLFAPSLLASATEAGLGTPMWTAPEQGRRNMSIGPSVDVWALGLVAFHVLTGKIFWKHMHDECSSAVDLAMEILKLPIATASERARELDCSSRLPAGFDAWFARCVDRDPAGRYPDAAAATEALRPLLVREAELSAIAGDALTVPRRSRWPWLVLAFSVLVVIVVLVAWWSSGS